MKVEVTDEFINPEDVQVLAVETNGVEANDVVSMAMMAALDNPKQTMQVYSNKLTIISAIMLK